jgi:SAM-dependent methyltransferase
MSENEKFQKRTEEYRQDFYKYGYSPLSLSMPSDRRNIRYFELLKHFDLSRKFVLLDAGCGFGDVNEYLKVIGVDDYQYIGLDVVDEFLNEGQKKYGGYYIHRDFTKDSIDDLEMDYVILSQVFNARYSGLSDNYNVMFASVRRLFDRCSSQGVAFNFFTDQVDYMNATTAYHNPSKVLEFAYSLSRKVYLDNGCMPYECTVTIMKDETSEKGIFKSYMEQHDKEFKDGLFIVLDKQ